MKNKTVPAHLKINICIHRHRSVFNDRDPFLELLSKLHPNLNKIYIGIRTPEEKKKTQH